jgi:hypothetical protein
LGRASTVAASPNCRPRPPPVRSGPNLSGSSSPNRYTNQPRGAGHGRPPLEQDKSNDNDDHVFVLYGASRNEDRLTEVHCFYSECYYSECYLITVHRDEARNFIEVWECVAKRG